MGRANTARQAVFYARSDFEGALVECRFMSGKRKGEKITFSFSNWQPKKNLKVIAIFNPHDIDLIAKSEMAEHFPSIKSHYEQIGEKHLPLIEYIANRFRTPIPRPESYRYKITAAFANMLFDTDPELGAILYQSVLFKDRYNFAIRKELIDKGYFVPSHFVKGTYLIEKEDVKELELIPAHGFDRKTGKINW